MDQVEEHLNRIEKKVDGVLRYWKVILYAIALMVVFLGAMIRGIYTVGESAGPRLKHLREENDPLRTENIRLREEAEKLRRSHASGN